jgi:hypothetical protein
LPLQLIGIEGEWLHNLGVSLDGDDNRLFFDSIATLGTNSENLTLIRELHP